MFPTDTADGSKTLYSEQYQEGYHSHKGAVSEAKHVFVAGSGLADLLLTQAVKVLEVGFGTGLNFFLSADMSLKLGSELNYIALEHMLLPADAVKPLSYGSYLSYPQLVDNYVDFRKTLAKTPAGVETFGFPAGKLELRLSEATKTSFAEDSLDIIYQDAFSPNVNPELWTESFFTGLFKALKPGGVMTSYCVKGEVRRRLSALGFEVEKRSGPPGGKREMLVARKPS